MAGSRSSTVKSQNFDNGVKHGNYEVSSLTSREIDINVKSRLKDVNKSLITSKEIIKGLYNIMSKEEEQSSRLALVSAVKVELDRASVEVDVVLTRYSEEIEDWRRRGKQKIKKVISSLAKEVEAEKKMRRRLERMNIKLGSELAELRTRLEKAQVEVEKVRENRNVVEYAVKNESDAGKENNETASQYFDGMDDESSESELLSIDLNIDDSTRFSEEIHWEKIDNPEMSFGLMSSLRDACSALVKDIELKRQMSEIQ